jgi:2-amino-4-hydroxy-6-hydroxymethyldihydropteridine diphosphokinase
MQKIALALGSNEGDRLAALRAAVKALAQYVDVTATSSVYETVPLYNDDQPHFLNAALIGTTKLTPLTLLWNIKRIETELGRTPTYRYGPRAIDIDIVFYGDQIIATPELTVPHPHVAAREFVLRPLADIASDWKHPQNGLTVKEMLGQLPDTKPANLGPLV